MSHRSGSEQIYVVDLRRPEVLTQITDLPGIVTDPSWSPDGRRIAFRWFRPQRGSVGVYVANADGSGMRLLVDEGAMPDWSPDGRFIVYANLVLGRTGIGIVDVDRALRGDESATRVVTLNDLGGIEEAPA